MTKFNPDMVCRYKLKILILPAFIDAIVKAGLADTFAAPVMKPSIFTGASGLTGSPTLLPRHTWCHIRYRAVDCDNILLRIGMLIFSI